MLLLLVLVLLLSSLLLREALFIPCKRVGFTLARFERSPFSSSSLRSTPVDFSSSTAASNNRSWTQDLQEKLRTKGQAGLVAYGLLNFVYYVSLTTLAWSFTGNPSGVSTAAALNFHNKLSASLARLGKISATVWVGSQATKAFRIIGAISLAPVVDKGLDFVQTKFAIQSRAKAVSVVVGTLLGITAAFYIFLIFGGALFMR